MQFQQSESTPERRRWVIVLVQDADPTAGLTGATGQAYISKNGGTPALSTNSIVEVDSTNMPGHYYLELTQAELDTLGGISVVMKTAQSKAFHDRGLVSYNDPYVSSGGFSTGSSEAKITKKQLDYIAEMVWKQVLGEKTAEELLILAATHPITDLSPVVRAVMENKATPADLSPVLAAISGIKMPQIPQPKDYSKDLAKLVATLDKAMKAQDAIPTKISKPLMALKAELSAVLSTIQSSSITADSTIKTMEGLIKTLDEAKAKIDDQLRVDKRLDALIANKFGSEQAQEIKTLIAKIAKELVDAKFEILRNIK